MATIALRVFLSAGHGLSNARPNVFDTGAQSCYGSEHEIVYRIVDLVVDHYNRDPRATIEVVEVPLCSTWCAAKHPLRSHLAYKIDHINNNIRKDAKGRILREVVLDLHMNSSDDEKANGTEVLYSSKAPLGRRDTAARLSLAVSDKLGTVNRGAKSDKESQRKSLAILNRTDPPAYLIELGFVTNPEDVRKVRYKGLAAMIAALKVLDEEHP